MMTVNLISDVHATLDPADGFKAIYAMPQIHTREQCLRVLESAMSYATSDRPDKSFKKDLTETEKYLYPRAPSSYAEYLSLIDEAIFKLKSWNSLSLTEKKDGANCIEGLEHWHYLLGDSRWFTSYKLKLDFNDVSSWMRKTYSTFDPAKLEPADYLVIAGDLGIEPTEPRILKDIKEKTRGKFKDVFYIAGNHSHWWHKIAGLSEEMPDSINLGFDYFEREVPGGWLFLGCTLWTPIPNQARWRIGRFMNDYRCIPGRFTPEDSNKQFEIQSTWLKTKIVANRDKKIVVFTHHQPFKECIDNDFKHNDPWSSDNVAEAYAVLDGTFNNLAEENPNVKIWMCGHTHQLFDEVVHGMRVVRNPIGYSDFYGGCLGNSECDPANWYNKVIDLGE